MFELMKDFEKTQLPTSPGCYIFLSQEKEIIYIGKAKNIRNRVSSYFNTNNISLKTQHLIKKAKYIDFETTPNEVDALLLESNLINKYEPKYNLKIKRAGTYPYIELKTSVPLELRVVNKTKKNKSKYFGPFPEGFSAPKIIRIIKDIFPIDKCTDPKNKNGCINYHIGKCIGTCVKKITSEDYAPYIKKITSFLNGNIEEIRKIILSQIDYFSEQKKYEQAKKMYETIKNIDFVSMKQKTVFKNSNNFDAISFATKENTICIVIKFVKFGSLSFSQSYIFDYYSSPEESFEQFVLDYYSNNPKPDFLILDSEYINLLKAIQVPIFKEELKKQKEILKSTLSEAKLKLEQEFKMHELKTKKYDEAISSFRLQTNLTKLDEIEFVDISSLQGNNQVGAVINYKNGIFNKSMYRKYIISSTHTMNDYESIYEVTYRHFRRKLMDKQQMPDLYIVDGKHQVKYANKAINELKLKVNVIGVVKNDKHITEALFVNGKIVKVNNKSPLWELLAKIQEETHRFVIMFHREKRTKSTLETILDQATFLDKDDINKLFSEFNTIRIMKISKEADIVKVIGKNKAKKLITFFESI